VPWHSRTFLGDTDDKMAANFPVGSFAKANNLPVDSFAKANNFPVDSFAKANKCAINMWHFSMEPHYLEPNYAR
jgi:hypothetical protein